MVLVCVLGSQYLQSNKDRRRLSALHVSAWGQAPQPHCLLVMNTFCEEVTDACLSSGAARETLLLAAMTHAS